MFFDLSWSHIILLLVVALVVVGPKDLPKIMRKAGQWTAKARAMADQFRSSFDEMARQTELDELRKEIDSLRNARPLADTERALNDAMKIPEVSIAPPAAAAAAGESAAGETVGTAVELPAPLPGDPVLPNPALPNQASTEPLSAALDAKAADAVFVPPAGEPAGPAGEPDTPLEGGITPPAP